jgi:hypothetical protein
MFAALVVPALAAAALPMALFAPGPESGRGLGLGLGGDSAPDALSRR